jgi:hypothetical protein
MGFRNGLVLATFPENRAIFSDHLVTLLGNTDGKIN